MSTEPQPVRVLQPPKAAAIAGVIFAVLTIISLVLIRLAAPAAQSDSGLWLMDSVRRNAVRLGIQLIPFAGIAFLWFIGVLRNRIGEFEDQFFTSVFLGSGLLFVGSFFASAAFSAAVVETVANGRLSILGTDSYYLSRQLAGAFMNVFAIKMAGVFMMSSSTIVIRTGILPRWVAFSGFSCAVVLLLAITNWPWIALLFPLWMLVVSARILVAEFRPAGRRVGR